MTQIIRINLQVKQRSFFLPIIMLVWIELKRKNHEIDPCALIRCSPHEICVANYSKKATCIARKTVMLDESNPVNSVKGTSSRDPSLRVDVSKRHSDAPHFRVSCGANECRFGECEMRNETQFVCHCFKVSTYSKIHSLFDIVLFIDMYYIRMF